MRLTVASLNGAAALALLVGCARPIPPAGAAYVPLTLSHPGLASSSAAYLELYRATPAGLLVAGLFADAPVNPNRDPGTAVPPFHFTPDPSVHGSYFWAFDSSVTYLDGACHKTDAAGLLAAANRPGGISVQIVNFRTATQRDWAPPAIHVFSRALNEPTDCSRTIMADPAFAPKQS